MNSVVTIPIKDVLVAEYHAPSHFALVVSRTDSDQPVRLGFASADAGAFMLQLRQAAASAASQGAAGSGGPTMESPRLTATQLAAASLAGTSHVEMTMRLGSGLHACFALDRWEAAQLATQLLSALEALPAPQPKH